MLRQAKYDQIDNPEQSFMATSDKEGVTLLSAGFR
jgi:hypothetical protein